VSKLFTADKSKRPATPQRGGSGQPGALDELFTYQLGSGIMKKLLVLACMASLVMAGQAWAQCNPDPDEICIFFAEDCNACPNCNSFTGER
jgi:hypothetical protein